MDVCQFGDSLKLVSIPTVITTIGEGSRMQDHDDSVQNHMPDWSHVHLDLKEGRDFVRNYFPDFLSHYDDFQYDEQRVNSLRYMWLYVYGGVVLDSTNQINEPIDRLFYSDNDLYLVPSVWNHGYYSVQFIGSRAKHPIWLDMLDAIKKPPPIWARTKYLKINATTGSYKLTEVIKDNTHTYVVLPRKLVDPCTICADGKLNNSGVLAGFDDDLNWDYKLYRWSYCNWWIILIVLAVLLVLGLLMFRRRRG